MNGGRQSALLSSHEAYTARKVSLDIPENAGYQCFLTLLLSILLICMLAGCGEKAAGETKVQNSLKEYVDTWENVQVLKDEWKGFGEISQVDNAWHPESCQDGLCPVPSLEWTRYQSLCAWAGDCIYHVSENCLEGKADDTEYYEYRTILEIVDTITEKSERVEVLFQNASMKSQLEELNLALKKGFAKVISLDVLDGKLYLFVGQWDEEFMLQHYYLVEMNRKCEVCKLTDLTEASAAEMISTANGKAYSPAVNGGRSTSSSSSENLFSDGERKELGELPLGVMARNGEICLAKKDGSVYLIGSEGIRQLEPVVPDITEGSLMMIGKAEDGTPVFTALHGRGNTCFFIPGKLLYDCESYLNQANLDETGGMLMWMGDRLIRWNVISGETEVLCSMAGLDPYACKGIWKNSSERCIIAFDDGEELSYYRYAPGKAEVETIRIATYFTDTYLKQCAEEYKRKHPGVSVEFVEMESPWQNATVLNRLSEECKAGTGPDIMILNAQQMMVLQSAGCLKNLDGTLSDETIKGMFDSALKVGTIESELYGVPYGLNLRCFLVARENYDLDSWNLQELMNRMEECHLRKNDMKSFLCSGYQTDPQDLLYELCLQNVADTPFIDMAGKNCSFDCEAFYRLLRFCKDYADHESTGENYQKMEEKVARMREGSALCYLFEGGLKQYSQVRAALGEGFAAVGVPSESGDGYLVTADHLIMVNAFCKKQEMVSDFLNEVLSERYQIKYGVDDWVREDVLRERVREHVMSLDEKGLEREEAVFLTSSRGGIHLAVDANGDSFVEEYIALMDRAMPPFNAYELRSIISEEAAAYFSGAKSEREVANVIDRRVRLFLQE